MLYFMEMTGRRPMTRLDSIVLDPWSSIFVPSSQYLICIISTSSFDLFICIRQFGLPQEIVILS